MYLLYHLDGEPLGVTEPGSLAPGDGLAFSAGTSTGTPRPPQSTSSRARIQTDYRYTGAARTRTRPGTDSALGIFGIAHRGGPCRQCRANDAGSNGGWGGHGGARKLRCSEGISAGAGLPHPEKTRLCRHSGGAAGIVSNAVTSFLPE